MGDANMGTGVEHRIMAGALVRPFETFDAVSAGVADMYHTDEAYFEKKSPAFHFFAAMPIVGKARRTKSHVSCDKRSSMQQRTSAT